MYKSPCLNCQDRTLGCHDKCDKYILSKSEHAKLKQVRQEQIGMRVTAKPRKDLGGNFSRNTQSKIELYL